MDRVSVIKSVLIFSIARVSSIAGSQSPWRCGPLLDSCGVTVSDVRASIIISVRVVLFEDITMQDDPKLYSGASAQAARRVIHRSKFNIVAAHRLVKKKRSMKAGKRYLWDSSSFNLLSLPWLVTHRTAQSKNLCWCWCQHPPSSP